MAGRPRIDGSVARRLQFAAIGAARCVGIGGPIDLAMRKFSLTTKPTSNLKLTFS